MSRIYNVQQLKDIFKSLAPNNAEINVVFVKGEDKSEEYDLVMVLRKEFGGVLLIAGEKPDTEYSKRITDESISFSVNEAWQLQRVLGHALNSANIHTHQGTLSISEDELLDQDMELLAELTQARELLQGKLGV